jgi:tagatose 1,6-diphosphate aldolase
MVRETMAVRRRSLQPRKRSRVTNANREEGFAFLQPGRLVDDDLELVLVKKEPANPSKGYVPCYHFEMRRTNTSSVLGSIRLRIGSARVLRYPGHIGYYVKKHCRGKHYAARSCKLLLPLAQAHGLKAVWLCCDVGNIASQKSCVRAGARRMGTLRVPKSHPMAKQGIYLRRYRIALPTRGHGR